MWGTRGTETSKYPEEEKSNEILRVVASESGRGQTDGSNTVGVRTAHAINEVYLNGVGKPTGASESLLGETRISTAGILSISGHEESGENTGGPPSKPKYYPVTDSVTVL